MITIHKTSMEEALSLNFKATLMAFGIAIATLATTPFTIQAQPNCVTPPSGLVSWWKAESNTLDTAGSNIGTIVGNTTYGSGRVGQAFRFDGDQDAVTVGNPINLQLQNFTIEAWIKRGSTTIVSLGTAGSGVIFGYGGGGYALVLESNGSPGLNQIGAGIVDVNAPITDTNFHHLAVTKSGSTVVFYVDGVGYPAPAFNSTFSFGTSAAIGGRPDNLDNVFLGSIDEVSVYNRALSAAEVQSIHTAGSAGKCPPSAPPACVPPPSGLISWWPGNGNSSDVAGMNNGIFTNPGFSGGEVNQSFNFNGSNYVYMPASASLDVGTGSGLTIEAWINPSTLTLQLPIVEYAVPGAYAVLLWANTQSPGRLYGQVIGTDGAEHKLETTNVLTANVFQHVAMTYDKASGIGRIIVNGAVVHELAFGTFTPRTSSDLYIGYRPPTSPSGPVGFQGQIDEVSLYNRALSLTELQSIYSAGSAGKCPSPACVAAPFGLVSWWPGSGNANDVVDGNSGVFTNASFGTGEVGQGFSFDGPNSFVTIPSSSSLNVGAGGGLTIEGWIKPSDVSGPRPLLEWNNNSGGLGAHFWISEIGSGGGPGSLYANLIDTSGGYRQISSAGGIVSTNSFQHVAVSYDKTTGIARLHFNGTVVATQNLGVFTPQTSYPLYLGKRTSGISAGIDYSGLMDEVGLYSRSLSSVEIQAIYNASSAGKCPIPNCIASPSGLVSWWRGQSNATDTVGANNGTISGGVSFAGAEVGQAFSFNGTGEVRVPSTSSLNVTTAFTFETWVNPSVVDGNGDIILNKENDPALSDSDISYELGIRGTGDPGSGSIPVGRLIFFLGGISGLPGGYGGWVDGGGMVPTNQWTHCALAFDGTSVRVYTNGSLARTINGLSGTITPTTGPFKIGSRAANQVSASPETRFNGLIDEVSVYNRALSGAEILAIYNADGAGKCLPPPPSNCLTPPSGLVSWWKAESNTVDQVGSNNGNLVGNATYSSGKVGQAFVFDSGGYFSAGAPSSLKFTNNFSVAAWIFPTGSGQDPVYGGIIFNKEGEYELARFADGSIQWTVANQNPGWLWVSTGGSAPLNQWTHIAFTYSSGVVSTFINGLLVQSYSGSGVIDDIYPSLNDFRIGARPATPQGFAGMIDEVSVFGRVITTNEVAAIYAAGSAGMCADSNKPVIITQPASQTVIVGGNTSFSVVAGGAPPFSYQWRLRETNIPGATASSLSLANIQFSQAGNYSVQITNTFGSILSSNALLTVNPQPPCVTPPSGLVSWWKAESNTLDMAGSNNGTIVGNTTYGGGRVGQAFRFDGDQDAVNVGNPINLQLQNLTIEAWIKRGSTTMISLGTAGAGVIFGYGAGGYALVLESNGSPGLNQIGAGIVDVNAPITDTNFHHLAVTKSGSTVVFYVDGVGYPAPAFNNTFSFGTSAAIGGRPDNLDNVFLGNIDEVSVYNRALSAAEILAIYNADGAGKCPPPPPSNCVTPPAGLVSWWKGESNTVDQIGNNNGTLVGNATYSSGKVGQAFEFDSGGYFSAGAPSSLKFTNNFSVAAWIFPTGSGQDPVSGGIIFNKEGEYELARFADGSIQWTVANQNPGWLWVSTGGSAPLNQWTHIAFTYSSGVVSTFINGLLVQSYSGSGVIGDIYPSLNDFRIGARPATPQGFAGMIDEVSVFGRVITTNEVAAIYAAGSAGMCADSNKPVIITQPAGQTVIVGGNTSFSVVAGGAPPLSYQWRLRETNIPGATASSLSLANIQFSQAGNYSVQITNAFGSIVSSNALLTVNPQPPCVTPPTGLVSWWKAEGNTLDTVGSNNGTLAGNTTYGTGRVGQAYVFDGSGDGVSVGTPTNLQLQTFTIEAWVKRSNSSVASLDPWQTGAIFQYEWGGYGFGLWDDGRPFLSKVGYDNISPTFAITDTNTFHHVAVTKTGSTVIFYLDGVGQSVGPYNSTFEFGGPAAAIGTRPGDFVGSFLGSIDEVSIYNRGLTAAEILTIYNADGAGKCPPPPSTNCVAPPVGLVSWWRGQSNALDSVDSNHGTLTGGVSFASGEVGSAFSFDGSGEVVVPTSPSLIFSTFTFESWVNPSVVNGKVDIIINKENSPAPNESDVSYEVGIRGTGEPGNGSIPVGHLAFFLGGISGLPGSFGSWVDSGGTVPTNRWTHWALAFDGTALRVYINGSLSRTFTGLSGTITPTTGPFKIGSRSASQLSAAPQDRFNGLIDEVSVYNRALSDAEILGIYNADGAGKCPTPSAPFIVNQPTNQTVTAGGSATFMVVAGGTQPLSYQWRFKETNIAGATGSSLTISNAQFANAGIYSVLVSNSINTVLSSNALLTVNPGPSVLRVGDAAVASGATFTVPVLLTANSLENALQFSLNFNTSRLVYVSAILANGSGATAFINESQTANGKLGIAMALPAGATFPAGTQELVQVTFTAAVLTNPTPTTISFVDQPIVRQVADAQGNTMTATYLSGTVSIDAVAFEADVSPRPSGDRTVTVTDWVLIGRFAAHLDSPTNVSQFQRADCAPRATLGNGHISITDWVQAGRYVAGVDPLTPVGGPTSAPGGPAVASIKSSSAKRLSTRQLRAIDGSLNQGHSGKISISLQSQGNENALGFSVTFDAARLTYTGATLGSGAAGATLNVNTDAIAAGRIGFALALSGGARFAAGLDELVQVAFQASASATGDVSVAFADSPIDREVSDTAANALDSDYLIGTLSITPLPSLNISQVGSNIVLTWPGWATNFVLQENGGSGSWSNVTATVTTRHGESTVTIPMNGATKFYRLLQQ